jgi:amidohydrolase
MTTDINSLKQQAFAAIDALRDEAVAIARDIHAHPELGWDTPRSAGLLTDFLAKHGMHVEKGVADLDCAFRASIPGRMEDGVGVAFLAEYDALPDIGHACSHSLIGTIAATAGIAVRQVLGENPGNVYVMGCPFEEGGGGKIYMIERGVFDVADVSLMWHGNNEVRVGSPNIAAGSMTYTFKGKPAHSGMSPHKGVNAADAAMLTFAGVNALRQHITSDARISGIISDGGSAANIVPEHAVIDMMTRAYTHGDVAALRERVHDCARGAALMTGTELEIHEEPIYAERLVVPGLREVVLDNLDLVGVPRPESDPQTFASADSGNVSQEIPHITFTLPVDNVGSVPHTAAFADACNSDMAYDALITAAKIMAASAIDLLTDPERVAALKAEHAQLKAERQRA